MFSMLRSIPRPTYTFDYDSNILDNLLDLKRVAGVYVWYGKDGTILYTGRTNNVRERIRYHKDRSHCAGLLQEIENDNISHIEVFPCVSELDTIVLERYLISSELYRGIHNTEFSTYEFSFEGVDVSEVDNSIVKVAIKEDELRKERERMKQEEEERKQRERMRIEQDKAIKEIERKRLEKEQRRLAIVKSKEEELLVKLTSRLQFIADDPFTINTRGDDIGLIFADYLEEYALTFRTTNKINLHEMLERHLDEETIEKVFDPITYHLESKTSKAHKWFRKTMDKYMSFTWYRKELLITVCLHYMDTKEGKESGWFYNKVTRGDAV
jgi:hypothetical protein